MDNKIIAQEWFRYAQQDLSSAKYLQNMKLVPIEIICDHCQQSIEKYLKGFIALHGGTIQKTHDLIALNKACSVIDITFTSILDDCLNLTDYGVQARYPFSLELQEADVHLAIQSAERIEAFLQKKISIE